MNVPKTRGIRHALTSMVPNWLSNRPTLNVGFRSLYALAMVFDFLVEMMLQGVYAAMPGKGTSTALPFIGASRGILQGLTESNTSFAVRLRNWLTFWYNAGSAEVMAQMIQSFLPNNPVVRIVDRAGNWVTANQDGTTTFARDPLWNWDSVSNPERAGWWSDIWVIVYPDPWISWETGVNPAQFPDGWTNPLANTQWQSGGPQGVGIGHNVPRIAVDGILSIVSTWKGAHTYVVAMIFTTIAGLFKPGASTNPGAPDGTWGQWGKYNAGTGTYVPSRTRELNIVGPGYVGHARYWTPLNGG